MSYIGNPINSVAFLTDQFSGNGSTTVFTMSVAPATTSSILVAVSGVVQDPSTYAVAGTTLTFSAAPPTGTGNVSVRYLGIPASGVATTAYRTVTDITATAGQTTFSVPSYTVGYINVYDNGVRQGAADFTATNGTTVVLATAALAGDLITVESFYVSSVLNAIPAVAGAVNSSYIAPNVTLTTPSIAQINSAAAATPPLFADSGGTQIGTLCRSWVNFNGTGTVAIRASFNVTSITDNGTGDYTVNFTNAMPDVNYCAQITPGSTTFDNSFEFTNGIYVYSTSSARIKNGRYGGGSNDIMHMNVGIFR
jgi:hypothetical protein